MIRAIMDNLSTLADLLLPRQCPGCRRYDPEARPLCLSCSGKVLAEVATPYCPRCGTTAPDALAPKDEGCGFCPTPVPRFDPIVRLGRYRHCLRAMVRSAKFNGNQGLCRHLGRLLASRAAANGALQTLQGVQPIAMHWSRRLRRGVDHAELLAETIADELDLPMLLSLVRVRNTPPQAFLPRSRRMENMKNAFESRKTSAIRDRHILLVDDVITSGATADEAARTLLRAGAGRVSLAVVARTEFAARRT